MTIKNDKKVIKKSLISDLNSALKLNKKHLYYCAPIIFKTQHMKAVLCCKIINFDLLFIESWAENGLKLWR